MASEEFFFDYEPKYFTLPKAVTEILNDVSFENLNELAKLSELEGLTMIRYDGKQPLTFSPDESRFSYLKTLGEIITSLDPSSYFKNLSRNFEYKGIGHLGFDDFDLFLAKIANNILLVIMANDPSSKLFRAVQKFGDELYEIFHQYNLYTRGETVEQAPRKKAEPEQTSYQRYDNSPKEEGKKLKKIKLPSRDQLKDSLRAKLNDMKEKSS